METILQFLRDSKTFYLATMDGDQPRVRPFGAVSNFEGKLYFCTNNTKKVSHQLKSNNKFEVSGMVDGDWLRLNGKAVLDERREAKEAMLAQNPSLKNMYNTDDGIFEVFYVEDGIANILSFAGKNEIINL